MNAAWLDTTSGLGQRGRVDEVRASRSRPGLSFIDAGGARLRVRRQPAEGRPAVVFACDGPNTLEHYDTLLELLEGRADVTVFDPPGTGCSEPPAGFDFSIDAFCRATLALLEVLDLRAATLVFPCYTGFIAARMAARDSTRMTRLVLPQTPSFSQLPAWSQRVDPRGVLRTPVLGQAVMALRRRRVAKGWFEAAIADRSASPQFVARANEAFDAGGCFCLASLLQRWQRETPDAVPSRLPVHVAWGKRDRSHRPTPPESFQDHAPHAHGTVFPELGHSVELEAPRQFLDQVLFPRAPR